ncbi:MAG TPA: glycosyltransferase family 4 protein [Tepidisphaeraceae bacterium]
MSQPRLLLLSQVYVPDPASVGQHLHDVAREMARRGWAVTVICSSRGYDDPAKAYPLRETRDGVDIRRYPLPLFSKTNMLLRVFGSVWAMAALFFMALGVGGVRVVMFSTSPPMVGVLGTLVASLKHAAGVYWAMDLNPDQLAAMGKLRPTSALYRLIESFNRIVISRSRLIVALDRFMGRRLMDTGRRPRRVLVIPPWPHESAVEPVLHADNPFRAKYNLGGKFVVMYSGNHTRANPLDTLLEATKHFAGDDSIRFAFIGGGMDKPRVRQFLTDHKITNALELPYQPLADLRYSLSAADVHVVTLGDNMIGIVHPCKIYGAMTVGRPILYVGPKPSHVTDILDQHGIGQAVAQGDVTGCVAAIKRLRETSEADRAAMGATAMRVLNATLSEEKLNGEFCDAIEQLVGEQSK